MNSHFGTSSKDLMEAPPSRYSGPIGKALLAHAEKLDVQTFEPMSIDFPPVDRNDLSTDQQYLFDICRVVSEGTCSEDIALRQPGAMNHSRWLTTANRILRLYIGTDKLSENLKIIARFIMAVYDKKKTIIRGRISSSVSEPSNLQISLG